MSSRLPVNRSFDRTDHQYRSASIPDGSIGKESFTLNADYNQKNHLYTFQYSGHGMIVQESEIMWEIYPMNLLAEKATEFIRSVDKQIGWDWKPSGQKLGHDEILAQLEAARKEVK